MRPSLSAKNTIPLNVGISFTATRFPPDPSLPDRTMVREINLESPQNSKESTQSPTLDVLTEKGHSTLC